MAKNRKNLSVSDFIDDIATVSTPNVSDSELLGPPPSKRPKRNQFRIRAKRFILSYSQIPTHFDRNGLGPWLKKLVKTITDIDPVCITIAVEEHPKTGGCHIHVYLDTGITYVINKSDYFDFDNIHPNIKGIQTTPYKALDYVLKDGEVIFNDGILPKRPNSESSKDEIWQTIMEARNREEFLKTATKLAPRDTVLHFSSVSAFADWRFRDNPETYISPLLTINWETYPELQEWVSKYISSIYEGRPRSLIIYGPTGLGKTLWARSLGNHAYFPGLFMLEGFNAKDAKYAIFDDMIEGLATIPNYKYWLGGQEEFVVGDKYMRKQRISWRM